ncbi:unnamed protein product [Cunninghamella echinulata]
MRIKRPELHRQHSFVFQPSSGQVVPLATVKEKLHTAHKSLTWPVIKKILTANLAVIITLGLLFYAPIRERTNLGGVLAAIAVEFIHPLKSLGFIAEDAFFGAFMCSISAAYSTLGTFCAFLVYDPTSNVQAQPRFCGVLASFLIVGAFLLNYVRVKFIKLMLEV